MFWVQGLLFFFVALLYSAVGFGGGSGYLAILSFTNLDFEFVRFIALSCNILVVMNGVYFFWREKLINTKKTLPLILFSVPMAFIGGSIPVQKDLFLGVMAAALLVASILMIAKPQEGNGIEISGKKAFILNAFIGGGIGFLSGLVGIGGGIFLSPFLHLIKWDKTRIISSTASLFILVNSMSGIMGQLNSRQVHGNWTLYFVLLVAVFIGAQIGSRLSAKALPTMQIKLLTAALVGVAALRIFYKLWS
jgi:uncharacterized membrane protein YfcA